MVTISPEILRRWAAEHEHANYCGGEAGYCRPSEANWEKTDAFPVSMLTHLIDDWHQWFQGELAMNEEDAMGREWSSLLNEDIQEEIVVLVRDGKGYIWDGWHRTAAVIVSGREFIPAIVGRPCAELEATADVSDGLTMLRKIDFDRTKESGPTGPSAHRERQDIDRTRQSR
jgi:hypothetical protein